jgi:hypothetical protein
MVTLMGQEIYVQFIPHALSDAWGGTDVWNLTQARTVTTRRCRIGGNKPWHADCQGIFIARKTKSGDSHQINCEGPCEAHPVVSLAQLPSLGHRPSGILGPAAL